MDEDWAGRQMAAARIRKLAARVRAYQLRYERAHDGRAVFAYVYHKITLDRARHIEKADEHFDDPAWLAELTEAFAERYFLAMDAIDGWLRTAQGGGPSSAADGLYAVAPRPWADVYRVMRTGRTCVLEDLLYSMMAHISHDLPLAVVAVRLETEGRSHVADYHRMNEVLARQTRQVEAEVSHRYNRFLGSLDRLAGRFGLFFTNYGIRVARSVAWYNAYRLLDPASQEDARGSIERSTAQFIRSVTRPDEWYLRIPIAVVRLLTPVHFRWRRRWPEDASPA